MPELPEVETVKRTLSQLVIGKKIKSVDVKWPKMIKKPDDVELFKQELKGQTIYEVGRRGKFLKFYLDDLVLVSHLRMEGRYGLYQPDETSDKHTHVIFTFTDNSELRYRDVRKFGTMHLFEKGREDIELPLSQLGIEPFDENFTLEYLMQKIKNTQRHIKTTLLDQRVVTGLGNIYVDEALFRANIHPERISSSITKEEGFKLRNAIVATLEDAVKKGGSTVRSYVNTQGEIGMFQLEHFVYGKKGEKCRECQTIIEKSVVGGRGTHYCPACQKLNR